MGSVTSENDSLHSEGSLDLHSVTLPIYFKYFKYLSLEPGPLGPKTIDESNSYETIAKCIFNKNCN